MREELEQIAKEYDCPLSTIVQTALIEFLKHRDSKEKE